MPTELRNEDELASSEEEDGGETEEMSPKKSERRKLRTKVTLEQGEEEENGSGRMEAGERRVLIMEETLLNGNPEIVQLRHPRSGAAASFLFGEGDKIFREVVTYQEENRCWFLEESVESNGHLYLVAKSAQRLQPLDQMLKDEEFPMMNRFLSCEALRENLDKVAERKGSADLDVWQFSETLTLDYLSGKVRRVSKHLKEAGVDIRGGAVSANYVRSLKEHIDEVEYLRYALGITSEYLQEDLAESLRVHLAIPVETKKAVNESGRKRSQQEEALPACKRVKAEGPEEDYVKLNSPVAKESMTALTTKQKALAKSAGGTKSITAFFKKK